MTGPLLNPKQIKAPGWMKPEEKALFRRLVRAETEQNGYVSQRKADLFADYASASTRLDDLRARLVTEVAANSPRDVDKARILTLNSSINTLAAQRAKLAAQL